MAADAESHNDAFAAAFHLRLLTQHAPDHLGWHQRYRAALVQRDPMSFLVVWERAHIQRLRQSPPDLLPPPHAPIDPPPGPRAKLLITNPGPPNFDD